MAQDDACENLSGVAKTPRRRQFSLQFLVAIAVLFNLVLGFLTAALRLHDTKATWLLYGFGGAILLIVVIARRSLGWTGNSTSAWWLIFATTLAAFINGMCAVAASGVSQFAVGRTSPLDTFQFLATLPAFACVGVAISAAMIKPRPFNSLAIVFHILVMAILVMFNIYVWYLIAMSI